MEKKRVGWWWACWLAIAIAGSVIGYPLSAGPVIWVLQRANSPDWLLVACDCFYTPAFLALDYVPESTGEAYASYLSWWYGKPLSVDDLCEP